MQNNQSRFMKHKRAGFQLSTLVLSMLSMTHLHAEDNTVEYVQVIGQAASMDKALKEQKRADQISSVVHADGIGQLPDDNAAEALQRIPGVSTERDQGEGRFVSVRGLGADLNAVTINGTLVPAPESDRRGVALDVLPSELVQSLAVVKTLTPDMDANSLGGTVQVESLSAFDHDGLFYTGTIEGGYDEKREKYRPKASGAISNRFSVGEGQDNLGVALALSYQNRKFGSDNVETGGAWDGDALEETAMRQYDIERERIGAGLNFDYRPNDTGEYYLRTLYSRFKDTESRQEVAAEFSDPQLAGQRGDAEVTRSLKSREETQEIQSFVLGGKQGFGTWTVEGQLGYSEASEENPGGISGAKYQGDFSNVGFNNTQKPVITADQDFYDAANYELDSVSWEKSKTTDKEYNGKLDFLKDYMLGNYAAALKFGGKISQREKTNNTDEWKYEDLSTSSSDFNSNSHYELGQFGPTINKNAIKDKISGLNPNDYVVADGSIINDFKSNEDIQAAYVMNTVDLDQLRVIAGLRYENTNFEARGFEFNDDVITATKYENDYDHWLPSLHLRYQLADNAYLRAAWTNSVVRPSFAQSAPGVYIDGDEAEFGNPMLKPLESSNFDLGVEKYFGKASMVGFYAFYKDIDNFIYNTNIAGTGQWADFDEAITYKNGNEAKLYGMEFAYSQKFDHLEAPWNGFLLGLNTTFSKSEADIDSMKDGELLSRRIHLPNQSDVVGNAMIGWENERFGVRLSANYKSNYLYALGDIDTPEKDIYTDDQIFLDFSSHVNLSKNLQLTFDVQNITDETYYNYAGSKAYNAQYEEYGPAYKLALTYTHF
ncbi:TonB-dependent receptor [Acinetobacter sp. Gutcm_16]|uniref:TonB-dependent receptor n=1 Tax=Acinetobacter sp. Gutcm_16 TaxID=3026087 RepID=UPI002362479C|nr:TonB-dependent receptor [Acinetobacter sp. Gutcm_16]MDD0803822.1 TonB-dependent receptor [Acinetobacter sp. Gutcm_16]